MRRPEERSWWKRGAIKEAERIMGKADEGIKGKGNNVRWVLCSEHKAPQCQRTGKHQRFGITKRLKRKKEK
jgi:hypothetical protein